MQADDLSDKQLEAVRIYLTDLMPRISEKIMLFSNEMFYLAFKHEGRGRFIAYFSQSPNKPQYVIASTHFSASTAEEFHDYAHTFKQLIENKNHLELADASLIYGRRVPWAVKKKKSKRPWWGL